MSGLSGDIRVNIDEQAIGELLSAQDGMVANALARKGIQCETKAKRIVHVITGRLRASIHSRLGVDSQGLLVKVGTTVEYAKREEMRNGHAFLRPALDQMRAMDD